jgi:hypothetical protein
MSFLTGLLGATLVGLVANWIVALLANIQAAMKRINSPPKPALGSIPRANVSGITTDPDVSPIRVLNEGCGTIIMNLLMMIFTFAVIGTMIALLPRGARPQQIPEEFWVGVLYAGLLGILIGTILKNWRTIGNLYKLMVNPPKPKLKSAEPPNSHTIAAAPPKSPQQVVVGGCFEIMLRLIFMGGLVAALIFSTRWVIRYLTG